MDLQQIKSKLDKVNRRYEFLAANAQDLSKIDKDAFLADIRNLYDACFEDVPAVVQQVIKEIPVATPKEEPKEAKETPKKKKPKVVFNTPTEEVKKEEPKIVSTIEAPPVDKTTKVAKEELKEEQPKKEEPKIVSTIEAPPVDKTPKEEIPTQEGFNEEYDDLFAFEAATDLSQKLSASPIPDLTRALALNEKFLYINQLFGGDLSTFQDAMQTLNKAGNMDNARTYMEANLIEQLNWTDKETKGIAKSFVKLIRRRYL